MNENHRDLLEGLRALALDLPREAPAHIEEKLRARFRTEKRRRKLLMWTPVFSAAAAAGIALLVWMHAERWKPVVPSAAKSNVVAPAAEAPDTGFYPLPEAEALPDIETAMVVRVELPVSSLQLMGVPVNQDGTDASVQADLLLGQDGLARGVRLVE
jgi:hypothetical protein